MGGTYLIQSVPAELSMDHTVVLQLAEVLAEYGARMVCEGLVWVLEGGWAHLTARSSLLEQCLGCKCDAGDQARSSMQGKGCIPCTLFLWPLVSF